MVLAGPAACVLIEVARFSTELEKSFHYDGVADAFRLTIQTSMELFAQNTASCLRCMDTLPNTTFF